MSEQKPLFPRGSPGPRSWQSIPCPLCGVAPGEVCVSSSGEPVPTHRKRRRSASFVPLTPDQRFDRATGEGRR